jgi:hypothetical protein
MRRITKSLLLAALLLLVLLPVAFGVTILLYPIWSWIETSYGIESVGHSGPADWCFGLVYGVLAVAGTIIRWRIVWHRRSSHGTPS